MLNACTISIISSVSDPNPDSIRSVDPYPDPDPGGKKLPTKIEKNKNFMFISAGCSLLKADDSFVA